MTTSTSGRAAPPHILHILSHFADAGEGHRTVRLVNAFGKDVRHTIVSADPDRLDAAQSIARGIRFVLQPPFPRLGGLPTPGRLQKIARAMKGYDLVCTSNWGAIDAVMAHTLFKDFHALPPLIHHEDGRDPAEGTRGIPTRTWYRRVALGKAAGLVVPTEILEETALVAWQQPLGRVKRIPEGIDTKAFAMTAKPEALRIRKRPGEFWIGTLARGGQLVRLIQALADLPEEWQLVIVGEPPSRDGLEDEITALAINHRVHLAGAVTDPARVLGLFDIFAVAEASDAELSAVLEAMASALPIVAPASRALAGMVAQENVPFLAPSADVGALAGAIRALAMDRATRESTGAANRARARAEFDETRMISTYRRLYGSAMGVSL